MGKNRNSNFSPTALKRSQMADKEKAYKDKLNTYGVSTYDPASLNKGVFAYGKDGRLIVRQLARAAEARNQSKGGTSVNRSNTADYKWDPEKKMYADKNLGNHYSTSKGEESGFDRFGVETVYDLDPETGALKPAGSSHFSFRTMKPNAGYFGSWLKYKGLSQENFDKLDWSKKVAYMREAKKAMMHAWQHMIENGYDPEKHRIMTMPLEFSERDSMLAEAEEGGRTDLYSRSGDTIAEEGRGRGRPKKEALSLEQAYYRNPDKYKDLDDETYSKVMAEKLARKDAGQSVGLSDAAKRSRDEYLEYKRRKALEAENKDQEPEADPKMGDTPSDSRTKRVEKMKSSWGPTSTQKKNDETLSDDTCKEIRKICASHSFDEKDFLYKNGSLCTFDEYVDSERHSIDDSLCDQFTDEQKEMHERVLKQLKKLASKKPKAGNIFSKALQKFGDVVSGGPGRNKYWFAAGDAQKGINTYFGL